MPLRSGPIASGRSEWQAAQEAKICLPCATSAADAAVANSVKAAAAPRPSSVMSNLALRMNERPRALEILTGDGVGGPISERADGAGRVVAVLLRKHRGAHDEEIVRVPRLQIAVDGARLRIGAHHRAAGVVRRLIRHDCEI